MSSIIALHEQVQCLADEICQIIGAKKQAAEKEIWESRWLVGEAISKSPTYEKQRKGNIYLFEALEKRTGLKQSSLYYCLEFYERFKADSFSNALESLPLGDGGKQLPSWRDFVHKFLPSGSDKGKKTACSHDGLVKIMVKCCGCGKVLSSFQ
jgi:hypothetical protein